MGRLDGRLVLILDADRVLSTDELLTASILPEAAGDGSDPAAPLPGAEPSSDAAPAAAGDGAAVR